MFTMIVDVTAREILDSLGFKTSGNAKQLSIEIPSWRVHDIHESADLIEEIGRVYGYRNIKGIQLPEGNGEVAHSEGYVLAEYVRKVLTEAGYTEILTYSLTDKGDIALANALASDKDHLRSNLSDAMREKLEFNHRNAPLLGLYDGVKMFEIGRIFRNEGMDAEHLQDYMQMEYNWA